MGFRPSCLDPILRDGKLYFHPKEKTGKLGPKWPCEEMRKEYLSKKSRKRGGAWRKITGAEVMPATQDTPSENTVGPDAYLAEFCKNSPALYEALKCWRVTIYRSSYVAFLLPLWTKQEMTQRNVEVRDP